MYINVINIFFHLFNVVFMATEWLGEMFKVNFGDMFVDHFYSNVDGGVSWNFV